MKRNLTLLIIPVALSAVVIWAAKASGLKPAVADGIAVGMGLALLQTFLSVGLMRWAWERKFFYVVWGGGILFRLFVFAATAFVVFKFTPLSLAATLLSLVTGTTLFLTLESAFFLRKE